MNPVVHNPVEEWECSRHVEPLNRLSSQSDRSNTFISTFGVAAWNFLGRPSAHLPTATYRIEFIRFPNFISTVCYENTSKSILFFQFISFRRAQTFAGSTLDRSHWIWMKDQTKIHFRNWNVRIWPARLELRFANWICSPTCDLPSSANGCPIQFIRSSPRCDGPTLILLI